MTRDKEYKTSDARSHRCEAIVNHFMTILTVTGILSVFMLIQLLLTGENHDTKDIYTAYGNIIPIALYLSIYLSFLLIPFTFCSFLGFILFNLFRQKPKLKASALFSPFICFRIVTKGNNVNLIKGNVKRNLGICETISLSNCIFEIITEKEINFDKHMRIREIVVPDGYVTRNRSVGKARCLNYSLGSETNMLSHNDWVVHLNEESILTDSALIGILNFINDEQYFIGQGVITYANDGVTNWLTTLSNLHRVGYDYGVLRFSLKLLHRPYFSCKDNFIVSRAGIEKDITFDFGPEASSSAESHFVMVAFEKGFKFAFIEGELWQQSPYSVRKLIQHRQYWYKGIVMLMLSKYTSFQNKTGLACLVVSAMGAPFMVTSFLMSPFFPLPLHNAMKLLLGFVSGTMWLLYIIGAIKSFHHRRFGLVRSVFIYIFTILIVPLATAFETCAFVWGVFSL